MIFPSCKVLQMRNQFGNPQKSMNTFDAKCKLMMQKTLSVFHLTSTLFMYYILKSTRSLFTFKSYSQTKKSNNNNNFTDDIVDMRSLG